MTRRNAILSHLKRQGPSSIQDLMSAVSISENAVRYHLRLLEQQGYIHSELYQEGVGRPAKRYSLTHAAEGHFPKRYHELLDAVLTEADNQGVLESILQSVAESLSATLRSELVRLPPRDRLLRLMELLDYGEMLGSFKETADGWEFKAYNCVYRDTGCRFEAVCDLLPQVIERSTMLAAQRLRCQRDGLQYCHFVGELKSI